MIFPAAALIVSLFLLISITHSYIFSHRPSKRYRQLTLHRLTPDEEQLLSSATDELIKNAGSLNPIDWYKRRVLKEIVSTLRNKREDERKAQDEECKEVYIKILTDEDYDRRIINRALFQRWNAENKFLCYNNAKVISFDELIPGESYEYVHVRV
jgi:hypothetical protein